MSFGFAMLLLSDTLEAKTPTHQAQADTTYYIYENTNLRIFGL